MKPKKKVYLTEIEQLAVRTMLSLEIKSNKKAKEMGIKPAFGTEMLKALFEKIAGFEWEEN